MRLRRPSRAICTLLAALSVLLGVWVWQHGVQLFGGELCPDPPPTVPQLNFTETRQMPTLMGNQNPHQLGSGDLNNDGFVDFAVGSVTPDRVTVYYNTKETGEKKDVGRFTKRDLTGFGAGTRAIAVGDIDCDGLDDIATASRTGIGFVRQLPNGELDDVQHTTYAAGALAFIPRTMALGDIDNNGDLDAVVGIKIFKNRVLVCRFDADVGVFQQEEIPDPGGNFDFKTNFVTFVDINSDGNLDILGGNTIETMIPAGTPNVVFLGDGNGDFTIAESLHGNGLQAFLAEPPPPGFSWDRPEGSVVADFNCDGVRDIASVVTTKGVPPFENRLRVFTATESDPNLFDMTEAPIFDMQQPQAVTAGDFNLDNRPDIAVQFASGRVDVFRNDGFGAFTEGPTTIFNKPGHATRDVVAADVNGDGQVDLAITQRDGPGRPIGDGTPDFALWAASNVWPFRRGDANNDGTVDIADPSSILKWLFLGTAPEPECLEAADTNDDMKLDIADPAFLLVFLFQEGEEPPDPGPDECGTDLENNEFFFGCGESICPL